jgi:hypothetical protein
MIKLIQRGGGTGPMKPGNLRKAKVLNPAAIKLKDENIFLVYKPLSV